MRKEVDHLVHQIDPQILVIDLDVHVHPTDQESAYHALKRLLQAAVPVLLGASLG